MRILLADDDAALREMFQDFIHMLGYQVTTAVDGQNALELIIDENRQFDLLISDVIMPRIGGIELVEVIRSKDANLPIILMSGYSQQNMESSSSHLNTIFLEKPIDLQHLELILRKIKTAL